ncbi:MAG: rhodanese-like domain-containing protein, partial [Cyclobacteriaceae bacterium]
VYPAHGAGSLCGKNLSDETFSTMGTQKSDNWAFQIKNEADFVKALLEDQPFVPQYFPFDVEVNRQGADAMAESIRNVTQLDQGAPLEKGILIVDTRNQEQFKNGHLPGALNIMEGGKFETWLGTLVNPEQPFYLIAGNSEELESIIHKAAKIGYEKNIKGAQIGADSYEQSSHILSLEDFKTNPENYLVVDIRNASEVKTGSIFEDAINIPLPELMERAQEVPSGKPVVVHCAGGYRSAAGSSILQAALPEAAVYDLSEAVVNFPVHMEV